MENTDNMYNQLPDTPLKHSRLGIASFIISIVAILIFIVSMVMATIFAARYGTDIQTKNITPDNMPKEFIAFLIAGLLMMTAAVANLVGAVLGIIGIAQKNKKKIFSVLGTIFNILPLLLFIALVFIGMTLKTP